MSSKKSGKRTAKQADTPQWTWNEERKEYYMLWKDQQGEVRCLWANEQNEEQATPRTAQVDSITETMAQVQVNSPFDQAAPGGDDGHNFTIAQTAEAEGKGKGKAVYYGEADNFGGASGEGSGADGGGTWPGDPFLGRSDAGAGVPHDQDALPDQEYTSDYRYDENPQDLQRALAASSGTYSQDQVGSSSTHHVDNPDYLDADEGSDATTQIMTSTTSVPDWITGTPGKVEPVDSRFRVMLSSAFQPGNVLKILWADPKGQGGRQQARQLDCTEVTQLPDEYGQDFHVKYRRFIVVANDLGHATCVPIYTYLEKGCTKSGVKPEQHGIIHENGTEPCLLPTEGPLGMDPIRMEIYSQVWGEKLHMASRVNYSKFVTIEHNVKVFFIGFIVPSDFDSIVQPAIDECWARKTHARQHEPQRDQHRERQPARPTKRRNKRR